MTDSTPEAVEIELTRLAERLTEPDDQECLRCYLVRMITEFGCDGTYRWTVRWRDVRAARPGGLVRRLEQRGGGCDCEVLINVFPGYPQPGYPQPGYLPPGYLPPSYPQASGPPPCAGVPRPGSAQPCQLRSLRKSA